MGPAILSDALPIYRILTDPLQDSLVQAASQVFRHGRQETRGIHEPGNPFKTRRLLTIFVLCGLAAALRCSKHFLFLFSFCLPVSLMRNMFVLGRILCFA